MSQSMAATGAKGCCWQILLVTDSIIDRKLASGLLTKHGHQVSSAEDGIQAANACQTTALDLVIIDVFVRQLNVLDLIHVIREREKAMAKPCVILALAADANELESQYHDLGTDGFLVKPLNIDQVNMWMERCARKQQQAACSNVAVHCEGTTAIDWTDALDAVGGRHELLKDLIDIFFEEYPPTMAAIRDSIDNENLKQLQLSAHKLKGCLRYFGRSVASEKAQELELLARSGTMSGAAGRLVELESAMSTLLPLLKTAPG
jgi:DNA-binding response OmpR family regulator